MRLAVEYAHANPALPGEETWVPASLPVWHDSSTHQAVDSDPLALEWHRLPALAWDAPAAFAAANGMSTVAGKALIRDALVLKHRAPAVGMAMASGRIKVGTARKIAQSLLGQHNDVCREVDAAIAARVRQGEVVGPVVVERLVDEAMLRLHAEERELDQTDELDKRHVTVEVASINHHGIVQVAAAADWADAAPFDERLSEIAEILVHLPEHQHETFDVRRSIALGILADPKRALALLEGDLDAKPSVRRELAAILHLSEHSHLFGGDAVVLDADQKAHLTQTIQQWVGRHDIALRITTVIRHCGGAEGGCVDCPARFDCAQHSGHAVSDYVPSERDKQVLELADRRCVQPWCNRAARKSDCDHVVPWDPDHPDRSPTCPKCNLAPLCRHHHRLKTHAGWRYWKLDQTTYLWRDPHGLHYLRTRDGTRPLE